MTSRDVSRQLPLPDEVLCYTAPGHQVGVILCPHPSPYPFPNLLQGLPELPKGVHPLLLEQHVQLVQGSLPLPQEGAGTMLQLPELLQEKRGSPHPFWQPVPTLQV